MESSHVNALQTKHAGIDRLIQAEQSRPLPDEVTLHELKKQKLKLKEEIARQ